jgi:prevent-host-death family protein
MKMESVGRIRAKFSQYVRASARSPVVITRNGKAVAAIVPVGDEDDLERLMLGYSPRLRAILAAARKRLATGAGVVHEEFWEAVETGGDRRGGK